MSVLADITEKGPTFYNRCFSKAALAAQKVSQMRLSVVTKKPAKLSQMRCLDSMLLMRLSPILLKRVHHSTIVVSPLLVRLLNSLKLSVLADITEKGPAFYNRCFSKAALAAQKVSQMRLSVVTKKPAKLSQMRCLDSMLLMRLSPILLKRVHHSTIVVSPKPALAAQKVSQMRLSVVTKKTAKLSQMRCLDSMLLISPAVFRLSVSTYMMPTFQRPLLHQLNVSPKHQTCEVTPDGQAAYLICQNFHPELVTTT